MFIQRLNSQHQLWLLDLQASVRLICTVALKVETQPHFRLWKRWDGVLVCYWTEPETLVTVLCFVECCCVLTFRATVDLRAVTQTDWSLVQCWNERTKIWCYNSLMDEDHCLYTSYNVVSCYPALLPVDMNTTTTTVVFTSTQTHDHNKHLACLIWRTVPLYLFLCNPEACHRSLRASLFKAGNAGSLLW